MQRGIQNENGQRAGKVMRRVLSLVNMINKDNRKFYIKGVLSGIILLFLYFLVLSLTNSFSHAITRLTEMWYWILPLVVGFGLQVGLYFFVRDRIKKLKNSTATVGATAGVSAGSMVACCAHHLIDVLPILGLSVAFLFLSTYQTLFLILGILSNIVAVIFMLEIIKKHSLHKNTGILNKISNFNIKAIKSWSIVGAVIILLFTFLIIQNNTKGNIATAVVSDVLQTDSELTQFLPSKINDGGGLSIEVKPIDFSFDTQAKFEITLDTHQGDLDFDLTKKAVLFDAENNKYLPLEWQGKSGGHHITGILVFPMIKKTEKIKFIINDIYNVKEREFLWSL